MARPGGPGLSPAEWDGLAADTIIALLQFEGAVTSREIEAKISEQPWGDNRHPIDAIHVTNALKALAGEGAIEKTPGRTRGGRVISVWHLPDPTDAVQRRMARKRLLQARYEGWATGTETKLALVGQAGEDVVASSLAAAAPKAGYKLLPLGSDGLAEVHGVPVPYGPLDNGATVVAYDQSGAPAGHATLLVEVKNVREHIYPAAQELHALLSKAAQLQTEQPDRPYLPVLVTRWVHQSTYWMASQCGFLVAAQTEFRRQFIADVPSRLDKGDNRLHLLDEVRGELGYLDLVATDGGSHDALVRWFERVPPDQFVSYTEKWATVGPAIAGTSRALAQGGGQAFAEQLRQDVQQATGRTPTW